MAQASTTSSAGFELTLRFKPRKGLGGGFYQNWITATEKVTKKQYAGVDSGAGCGNPFLTVWLQRDEDGRRECYDLDVRDLMNAALEIMEKLPPKPECPDHEKGHIFVECDEHTPTCTCGATR